jgi:ABC-type multidrug transport system ATPase subunit
VWIKILHVAKGRDEERKTPTTAIETENLTKIFDGKIIAVNNLDLSVKEGSIYGFLGPNAAGKTTTIRLLLGLIKPSAGSIRVFGKEMNFNSSRLRKKIGYLPTNPKFPPRMTPIKYLDFIGKIFCLDNDVRAPRLSKLIRAVDLLPAASREIKGFSTGMTTRLGMAAALMNDPELLVLDEPTSGLDPAGRRSTLELIKELGKEKTILISSHILSDIERTCTHVGVINEGKLIFSGSIKEMKKVIRSNSIRIEVDGNIDAFCSKLKDIKEIASFEKIGGYSLQISFYPDVSISKVIADVMKLISECKLELLSVSTETTQIEDAFLKLVEEEESHGFLRAIKA